MKFSLCKIENKLRRCYNAFILAILIFTTPSFAVDMALASDTSITSLSEADLHDITRIEQYLDSISTIQARFIEMASTGEVSEGDIRIWRPGKLRIDYAPPKPVIIKTNGFFLVIHDTELDQMTHIPLATTPLSFLVDEEVELNGNELAVTQIKRGANTIEITVVQRDDPLIGEIRFMFSDQPLTLRQWAVLDAQGITTNFALIGARTGVSFDPEIFVSKMKKHQRKD